MSTFIDGPAKDETLMLRRAPHFLRVVHNGKGEWDALDQLHDKPTADEQIYVYRLQGEATRLHLCVRGKNRGASGWYERGEYVLHDPQPSDEVMRDNDRWQAWAVEEYRRLQ